MHSLFQFLKLYIQYRIGTEMGVQGTPDKPVLEFTDEQSPIMEFFRSNQLTDEEAVAILLTLAPHVLPNFLTGIISDFFPKGGEFTEFGGIKTKNHRGIIPTGETALYILAGNDPIERMRVKTLFHNDHRLNKSLSLRLGEVAIGEPKISGALLLDEEIIERLTTGKILKPTMSSEFPASLISTNLSWDDLILSEKTLDEIKEIETWLQYNDVLLNDWNMSGIIKPGYRVMLYGAPGTGKTLTATLLGKYTNQDVYRIDLSMVVSKYIGETEKNLSALFDKAANKKWILFFDEADAIFGKRTSVRDAHDKYANQEVSYLLQRIEAHPGLVILASNLKNNIDAAFTRRFQSIIEFKLPTSQERHLLWKNNLPENIALEESISLDKISRKYEVTGANIVNIVQFACLQKLKHDTPTLQLEHLLKGIEKEYIKEGKMI